MSIGIPKGGVPGELVQKPAESSSAEKAAQDLEAFFVRQMLAELRASSDNPVFGGGYAGKMFQEMLDERMAEQMSKAGGLGIADLVAQDLQEHEKATQLGLQMPGGPEMATRSALRRGHAHYASGAGGHLDTLPVEARTSSSFGRRIIRSPEKRAFTRAWIWLRSKEAR